MKRICISFVLLVGCGGEGTSSSDYFSLRVLSDGIFLSAVDQVQVVIDPVRDMPARRFPMEPDRAFYGGQVVSRTATCDAAGCTQVVLEIDRAYIESHQFVAGTAPFAFALPLTPSMVDDPVVASPVVSVRIMQGGEAIGEGVSRLPWPLPLGMSATVVAACTATPREPCSTAQPLLVGDAGF